jgi:2-iminobutanoate/2-iminopropanoate deaminase
MAIERVPEATGFSISDAVGVSGEGQWVFISGQVSFDDSGKVVGEGLGEQAGICFDKIDRLLGTFGGSLSDVVRITAYVTTLENYGAYGKVRGERFAGAFPASATVQVAGLLAEGALIELDAVAFVGKGDR